MLRCRLSRLTHVRWGSPLAASWGDDVGAFKSLMDLPRRCGELRLQIGGRCASWRRGECPAACREYVCGRICRAPLVYTARCTGRLAARKHQSVNFHSPCTRSSERSHTGGHRGGPRGGRYNERSFGKVERGACDDFFRTLRHPGERRPGARAGRSHRRRFSSSEIMAPASNRGASSTKSRTTKRPTALARSSVRFLCSLASSWKLLWQQRRAHWLLLFFIYFIFYFLRVVVPHAQPLNKRVREFVSLALPLEITRGCV